MVNASMLCLPVKFHIEWCVCFTIGMITKLIHFYAESLRWGPNATYIPPVRVGSLLWGNANISLCVGGNTNFSVFGYQHVGIPNAKPFALGPCVGLDPQCEDPTRMVLRRSRI